MPRNPWLAIDAATPPALRARELRRDWERFLSGARVSGVRPPVADSWRRSLDAGIDPSGRRLAPATADRQEASARWEMHPLAAAAPLIRECLGAVADASEHLLVVSDAAGVLLQLEGNSRVRSQAADSMNFTEGALWSENGAGTNAVGTALAADHAVQIFAGEHFVEVVQAWTCSAAPVHDPETGELLGVIDLTGLEKDVDPQSLAVVMTTARAVEGHLRYRLQERDDRLRARYQERITGSGDRRALVGPTGRLIADDSRGWLHGTRLELPRGGGELVLPDGAHAFAEPVGPEQAFVVRELPDARTPRHAPRDELRMLAAERAGLRRLAAAVAHDASPADIFTAVAEEVGLLLGAEDAAVVRFEPDRTATILAGVGRWVDELGVGMRVELDDSLAIAAVARTGRSARVDDHDYATAPGPVADYLRRVGSRSAVASPIVVEGRLWGAIVAATKHEPLCADTEKRMASFTELVGTVIANAESRAELTAARGRVVAAGEAARRRIQRDLHDGAQQRLVSTVIALKLARRELGDATGPAVELVAEALAHAERAHGELRELAHGTLPAALSSGGLRAGIDALVSRIHLPVSVDVTAERLPVELEAAAYFIVAEALTNTVRHARASSARITAVVGDGVLCLEVRDDGVGGARSDEGSGLVGLRDRAAAMDGELRVESPPGEGTVVVAALPLHGSPVA
ncbi:MAG TPA: GAF domain-containing protein [Baekduia sp.]|uniref:GAF domain-containing protein n=1 Tax=Baekduia sp. TaxID=2600305 RepID=UPI002CA8B9E7|nr:GAF domain-containing protein [Baekduia sp.]HMJ32957.1 GAF domain-containing protein [Baekduia sp.]